MPPVSSVRCAFILRWEGDSDTERYVLPLAWLRTAELAKRRGLDVEAVEIEGDHTTHVPAAMRQSISFFQKIYAQEIALWNGEPAPLPKTSELDLGKGVKLKVARIEPGKFQMGSPPNEVGRGDDEAQHEVNITKPYAIGVYEVTQAQYRQVLGTSPSVFSPRRGGPGTARVAGLNTDNFPVEFVRWEEAMDFCRAVSLMPGVVDKGWVVDLPTEAEWEYAARAGMETAFPYGNALSAEQANFNGNNPYGGAVKGPFLGRPTTVGSYASNAWGLSDMLGNVNEWCKDWYDKDYQNQAKADNRARIIRGGGWGGVRQQLPSGPARIPGSPPRRHPHRFSRGRAVTGEVEAKPARPRICAGSLPYPSCDQRIGA